jgi:hypothetical protein
MTSSEPFCDQRVAARDGVPVPRSRRIRGDRGEVPVPRSRRSPLAQLHRCCLDACWSGSPGGSRRVKSVVCPSGRGTNH